MNHTQDGPVHASAESAPRPRKSPREAAGEHADVVLVSMPFGPLRHPSIALGLLESTLDGVRSRSLYFTTDFARRVDPRFYDWIASEPPTNLQFLGDWLFALTLFPELDGPDDSFLDDLAEKSQWSPGPEDLRQHVRRARREVEPFLDDCLRTVLALEPKLVGFTSVFQQQLASLALAQRLKAERPDLFIVFGGANCEGVMGHETVRQFDTVDAVVSGEGEVVFPDLVHRVLAGRPVDDLQGVSTPASVRGFDGPCTNAPRLQSLDALPQPDYSTFFDAWDASGFGTTFEPSLPFETSRGCWWGEKQHCTFCGLNGSSMAFRSKTSGRALGELEALLERYPVSQVQVVDNILDMRYFDSFIPALAERRLGVELFYEVKANLNKHQLQLLLDAGITAIQPGIESLSSHVLQLMAKGVSMLQNIRLLKWCREVGVRPLWNIIWGFPREHPEDYAAMAALMPWLTHLEPPIFAGQIRLDRFSPNFDRHQEFGFENIRPFPGYRRLYPFDDDVLARLAYYFEYDHTTDTDVAEYTADAAEAVQRWQAEHRSSALFYIDKADQLMLCDWRPAARQRMAHLSGDARKLYLACDDIRSLRQLIRKLGAGDSTRRHPVTPEDVEQKLGPLVDNGWMVREGDKFLSLAIPQPLGDAGA